MNTNQTEHSQTHSSSSPTSSTSSGTSGFLNPERIVSRIDIRPGMAVADFGCGSGHFAIPAARLVGASGKVFAIDIQKHAIELIQSRANLEHLLQIEPLWADLEAPEGSRLSASSLDVVIISNILFQAERKQEVIKEALRVLKPGAHLAIIEWDETPFPAGPPMISRMSRRSAQSLIEGVGFSIEKEFDAGSHHYGLLFKKQ